MGVRITTGINAVPASFAHGVLFYYVADKIYQTEVTEIKSVVFKKQCNFFLNKEIFAYLTNDIYGMVLRRDGSGCIYYKKTRVLIKNFMYTVPVDNSYMYIKHGGIFIDNVSGEALFTDLYWDKKDTYILSILDIPLTITFREKDNLDYLHIVKAFKMPGQPIIKLEQNCILGESNGYYPQFKINGTINYASTVRLL